MLFKSLVATSRQALIVGLDSIRTAVLGPVSLAHLEACKLAVTGSGEDHELPLIGTLVTYLKVLLRAILQHILLSTFPHFASFCLLIA